jgi:hypothetical protein
MATITQKYILVCDEVRQEINGKFIILGAYTPDMTIPQIPFALPSLTFFIGLESDRPGNFGMRFSLEHLESGQVIAQGMGNIGFQKPGVGPLPLSLKNVLLHNAGTYVISLNIDGQKDPITSSFSVILLPQQQPGLVPGFPQMR